VFWLVGGGGGVGGELCRYADATSREKVGCKRKKELSWSGLFRTTDHAEICELKYLHDGLRGKTPWGGEAKIRGTFQLKLSTVKGKNDQRNGEEHLAWVILPRSLSSARSEKKKNGVKIVGED